MSPLRIALLGDYQPTVIAHQAIPKALELAARDAGLDLTFDWLHSSTLAVRTDAIHAADGFWCVPASPYADTQAVLSVIRRARESHTPYLGTCGGFQHALLEFAHNVLHLEATHAELEPDSTHPLIAPLSCALVEASGSIRLSPDSLLARAYGSTEVVEEYHCSFGLASEYEKRLEQGGLSMVGRDPMGGVRAVELSSHPFYVATLFQPERAALHGQTPPVVRAFVSACVTAAERAALYKEGHESG